MTASTAASSTAASTWLFLALVLLTGSAPACGSDDGSGAAAPTVAESAAEAGPDSVEIVGFQFEPGEITVARGTTVTFTNGDDFAHTAVAEDDSFDTGTLDAGASAEVTFDQAGEFAYLCGIHNYMTGMIVVE